MKVVVIGGGFCGAWAAKKLDRSKDLEVVLIDCKDYFEYTPSIWKLLIDTTYYDRIILPHTQYLKRARVVTDPLVQVTPTLVQTKKEKIKFDYLLIAPGIDYPVFLDDTHNVFTVKSGTEVLKYAKQTQKAKTILIIGGGVIGVEVAAELATRAPEKRIIIVHPFDRLLERNTPAVSRYARRFFEEHGVHLMFNQKIVSHEKGVFVTDKNQRIKAECGIWCAGIKWNPWYMQEFPASIYTEKKALKVNEYLQLEGYSNIFVGGDINDVAEEKTAAAADRQAIFIAENIHKMVKRRHLYPYTPIALPMDISLGWHDGIITYRRFMFPGVFAAIVKQAVEYLALIRL